MYIFPTMLRQEWWGCQAGHYLGNKLVFKWPPPTGPAKSFDKLSPRPRPHLLQDASPPQEDSPTQTLFQLEVKDKLERQPWLQWCLDYFDIWKKTLATYLATAYLNKLEGKRNFLKVLLTWNILSPTTIFWLIKNFSLKIFWGIFHVPHILTLINLPLHQI